MVNVAMIFLLIYLAQHYCRTQETNQLNSIYINMRLRLTVNLSGGTQVIY